MADRVQLRPALTAAERAELYQRPYRHDVWADHRARVRYTVHAIRSRWAPTMRSHVRSIADLSCGDAAIVHGIASEFEHPYHGPVRKLLGDIVPGHAVTGPIEDTIYQIPDVDLLICTETVEHLIDPDTVLSEASLRARYLVLSTPVGAWEDTNPEHLWAWSAAGVEAMLTGAGWEVRDYLQLPRNPRWPYMFGLWLCRPAPGRLTLQS